MRISTMLLPLTTTAAVAAIMAAPQPTITNISYWGSACPTDGLSFAFSPINTTTNTASLAFTLANFLPTFGSFGSSLRMCNVVGFVSVEEGWKVSMNRKGTIARGNAQLKGNATMYLRATYSFAESAGVQSIGMLDVPGPLAGPFSRRLTPVEGSDGAVVGGCDGEEEELDIEFQARAVDDQWGIGEEVRRRWANETMWELVTDVDVVRC